jgi:type VI secretion system protein ImpB
MSSSSGQKTIGRQRPPRVQIEYDVELYGATKKVELPMVVGVMADLYGQQETPPPKVDDRKFLEIDHDNFDSRMHAMKPRVVASVPNRLTGEGNLGIELTFESIQDFSPEAIANQVEPLRRLLEARKKLADLVAFMDGRGDAEALISAALKDPERLFAITAPDVASLSSSADTSDVQPSAGASGANTISDKTVSNNPISNDPPSNTEES